MRPKLEIQLQGLLREKNPVMEKLEALWQDQRIIRDEELIRESKSVWRLGCMLNGLPLIAMNMSGLYGTGQIQVQLTAVDMRSVRSNQTQIQQRPVTRSLNRKNRIKLVIDPVSHGLNRILAKTLL